ncbi:hypothetical protein APED_20185 [Acanthopleuribacter pedis]
MEVAKTLLVEGKLSLKQVAMSVVFVNLSVFETAFKGQANQTPGVYPKLFRE